MAIWYHARHLQVGRKRIMDSSVARVREFIGAEPIAGKNAFLTTFRRNGQPYLRQVSTFFNGWTVETISREPATKVDHLRANPAAVYLWVETCPEFRRRNVWMYGSVEIVEDPAVVQEFLERRQATIGTKIPPVTYRRVLLRFTPTFLRGEGFQDTSANGYKANEPPVILRSF
ncbi:MAG: pyridoxamine 5'-phosphate oxidase family protein [Dehalococcoidia bacterium]|nr:pyridoxamine 5'-phosphate oxidase family protein [Dehalococcoidia bacterium]